MCDQSREIAGPGGGGQVMWPSREWEVVVEMVGG